ncbi:PTR2-domain-containing protein [Phellopilus nigrolimitatus]|nr:PTR2-domain-containing protein [Phellopilus nigrolimitatus]
MAGLHADDAALAALADIKHAHDSYPYPYPYPLDEKQRGTPGGGADSYAQPSLLDAGAEAPSEEDRYYLRRVADTFPWSAYLIAFVELAERFSYYGTTVVFTNFIQQPLPPGSRTGAGGADGQSGALNMGQRGSTGLTTFNNFWVYVTPLFGAYIADAYWGRYKTICYAVGVAIVGHVLLVVSAVPAVIGHSQGSLAVFVVAIVIMGAGTGGFKSNISPLVAEQYRGSLRVITLKSGERVIVDPTVTASRIYMYFYLFINIGALVGQVSMTYSEKYVGFWLAFLLPTVVFLSAPLVLFLGRNRYVRSPPAGSVLSSALRIWRFAARKRWSLNPVRTVRNLKAAAFWEDAKPSRVDRELALAGGRPAWMTWDDQWVDEVRRGFKACAVFVWFPLYWLAYNQLNNNLTSQAATMSTHGLPNDILSNLDPFALIILIPVCDILIYPLLARAGIRFTPLKKITMGFFTGAGAMVWAAVVQHYVYKTNPCGYAAATCVDAAGDALVSPLNVWIQTGSYILIALSEILASITGLEYAFTKAPRNMRSLVMAVYLFTSAIASAIGEAFVSLSTDPLLVWNYGVMGVIAGVAGVLFWLSFRHLDAEEDALNELARGRVDDDEPVPL